jgi:hypothetical protein
MARMKPDTFEYSSTNSPGEELVFEALKKKLDDNWLVCHSWRWLRHPQNHLTRKIQGEGDFVIFHPEAGIIVIEVKTGEIEFREDGKYYSKGGIIQNPEKQASDTKFEIVTRLKEKGLANKVYVSHAVWFPSIIWSGDYPANLSSQILFDQMDLDNPEVKLRSIASKFHPKVLDEAVVDSIEKFIAPTFKMVKTLRSSIKDNTTELVRLTQQQIAVYEQLGEYKCLGVRGRAGTGKTLLAINKARQLNQDKKKVLFLCFNKSLAERLKSELADTNVDVFTFHQYAGKYLRIYKPWRINDEIDEGAFYDFIGDEFSEVISENEDKYECCIIDEAQDIKAEWFTEIKNAFVPLLHFYFFFDPLQIPYSRNITVNESQFDLGGLIVNLYKNMRNTRQISQAAYNILGYKYNPTKHFQPIEGNNPEVVLYENVNDIEDALSVKLNHILNIEFIDRRDITILSMNAEGKSAVNSEIYGFKIIPFRKFKGLENDIIMIIDITFSHFYDPVYERELYVAITRGRYSVTLFVDNANSVIKKAYEKELQVKISKNILEQELQKNNYE